jgi:AcrR family transcriptional regulator
MSDAPDQEGAAPRRYTQDRRARQSAARRDAILDAAEALLLAPEQAAITVDTISERADVARATVFSHFGSKGGVLAALVERLSERGGSADLAEAMRGSDTLQALEVVLEAGTRLWACERPLLTALRNAAGDPALATAWADKAAGRRQAMTHLAGRLAADRQLAAGLSEDDATHLLDLLTSFETHEHLAGPDPTGRTPAEITALLRRLATAVVPGLRSEQDSSRSSETA